jgi:uncharacterized protein (TIGR03435 family)
MTFWIIPRNFCRTLLPASSRTVAVMLPVAIGFVNVPMLRPQAPAVPKPQFEVASIKACKEPGRSVATETPGRLIAKCRTMARLVQQAYANGRSNSISLTIEGPAWIYSDRFDISAKAEGNPGRAMMNGPMLQALLEDRFKLQLHRETTDVPAYALVVAKSGFKLPPAKERGCIPIDTTKPSDASKMDAAFHSGQAAPNFCGLAWIMGIQGGTARLEMIAASLDEFSKYLGAGMDRPLIDKTGIPGRFDFHIEFAPDETTPGLLPHDDELGGRKAVERILWFFLSQG